MLTPSSQGTCAICYGDNHPGNRKIVALYSLVDVFEEYPKLVKLIAKKAMNEFYCKDCFEERGPLFDILFDVAEKGLWFSTMDEARKLKNRWLTKQLWDIIGTVCPGCGAPWDDFEGDVDTYLKIATDATKTYERINNVPKFLRGRFKVCLDCCEKAELKSVKGIKKEDLPLSIHKFLTPKGKSAFEARLKIC
jgi:hypothetical protein